MLLLSRLKYSLVFVVCLLTPLALHADDNTIHFTHLTRDARLSSDSVNCIHQDLTGFMWFGTAKGLNRFDGYNLKVFSHHEDDPTSISGNYITTIFEDAAGTLWIGTDGKGLNRFNPKTETFQHFKHDPNNPNSISNNWILSIIADASGNLWIGTDGGGLNKFEPKTESFVHFKHIENNPQSICSNDIKALFMDRKGVLWIGTDNGLDRYNIATNRFFHYQQDSADRYSLSDNMVRAIYEDKNGYLWVGTFNDGLNRLDPVTGRFHYYGSNQDDPTTIGDNLVRAITEDRSGTLWVGTNGGLSRYDRENNSFQRYQNNPSVPTSLAHDSIWAIYEDRAGVIWIATDGGGLSKFDHANTRFDTLKHKPGYSRGLSHSDVWAVTLGRDQILWIGTNGGGLNRLNRKNGKYKHYRNSPLDPKSLSYDEIWSLVEDKNGDLWVGTGYGLNRLKSGKDNFTRFLHDPEDEKTISGNNVRTLAVHQNQSLWIGTEGGLDRMNLDTGVIKHFRNNPIDPTTLSHNDVQLIKVDLSGKIWVSSSYSGISLFSPEQEVFIHFRKQTGNPQSLPSNEVHSVYEDREGFLWLGTGNGLAKYIHQGRKFSNLTTQDGLLSNTIYAIQADDQGRLWLSTDIGINRFDPRTKDSRVYDVYDGLQSGAFNPNASYYSKRGEMFFGGSGGLNFFKPNNIKDNLYKPPVIFTEFNIFDKVMKTAGPTHLTSSMSINHDTLFFTVKVAALNYSNPEKNLYKYNLEGISNGWNDLGTEREITIPKLNPGSYTLKVKAANNDGIWSDTATQLSIEVKPPTWQTQEAIFLYGLLAIALTFFYVRMQQRKLENQRMIARKEHQVAQRLRQVDRIKDEFLASTSHELRTPLNGIIGLAESLIDGVAGDLPPRVVYNLSMIVSSGKRLGSLVNDILDFSMLKNRSIELRIGAVDLNSLGEMVCTLSRPLLGAKDVKLINNIGPNTPLVQGDENRLLQVLHNLVGNAIKFTEKGAIELTARELGDQLEITVRDTGIGISKDKLETIFESFGPSDETIDVASSGTGLGLAITKKLINLHQGNIRVISTEGMGSRFICTLPVAKDQSSRGLAHPNIPSESLQSRLQDMASKTEETPVVAPAPSNSSNFKILIVDDEPINRQVLINHLALQEYAISEASSGAEALKMISEQTPPFDMILLDIMMPRMSGYDVCKEVRKDYPFHEMPVIFLSAKNQVADLVHGFESGANDYISKPINKKELLSRVQTHLQLLDVTRNLEHKVQERTRELQQQNQTILRTQKQLIMKDKMASLGTLTAGIAHEIRNPLNFINNLSEVSLDLHKEMKELFQERQKEILDDIREAVQEILVDMEENASIINHHGQRASHIVQSMMDLAKSDSGEFQHTGFNAFVDEFINIAYHSMQAKGLAGEIQVQPNYDPSIGLIPIIPESLGRAILNLMHNAIEAVETKRETDPDHPASIWVSTRIVEEHVELKIRDNGIGIEQENLDKIFTPFFTTKVNFRNIGLGLSISYDIAAQHAGEIKLDTSDDHTLFCISLPLEHKYNDDQVTQALTE